jgi:hypothetical protein
LSDSIWGVINGNGISYSKIKKTLPSLDKKVLMAEELIKQIPLRVVFDYCNAINSRRDCTFGRKENPTALCCGEC